MKEVARMIPKHFDGIVAWTQTRQTNGFLEALNGLFQAAKRRARGYANLTAMRTVLFLIAGKLDFASINQHAGVTHSNFNRANFLDLQRRTIFFINVPIGMVALYFSRQLKDARPMRKQSLDWIGIALSSIGISIALLPLLMISAWSWNFEATC
ncbi:transposase [Burkholderia humptydooensis]|uniref:Transposase n=1 Tax=Burkholderia humptydooensis MSMB43 TaxID=441157 RepID=A0ABN0G0I8_9BURK|nr:transposase [Burkholderia humptydooensis]EIP85777.1 transposase [Burkholderia humptydooensis MSMB43]